MCLLGRKKTKEMKTQMKGKNQLWDSGGGGKRNERRIMGLERKGCDDVTVTWNVAG